MEGGGEGKGVCGPRSMFCPHLTPHSPPVMHLTLAISLGNPGLMQPCMGTVTYCVGFDGLFYPKREGEGVENEDFYTSQRHSPMH